MEDLSSGPAAKVFAGLIIATIFTSTAAMIAETLPGVHRTADSTFRAVEATCVAIFTAEFVLRWACTPEPRIFMKQALNVIDVLAVVPFYFELLLERLDVPSTAVLRVVRLIRIFRLLKVSRYMGWLRLFAKTLRLSLLPLIMLVGIILGMLVFVSSLAYFAERGTYEASSNAWLDDAGNVSPYSSIPATFWWAVITMSTIGYGDVVPTTGPGRLVAVFTMFAGIVIMAIPISVISTNYNVEYGRMTRLKELRAALKAQPPPAPPGMPEGASAADRDPGGGGPAGADGAPHGSATRLQPTITSGRTGGNRLPTETLSEAAAFQKRAAAAWSEPFLRSALDVVRTSRRSVMSALKSHELANREDAVADVGQFVRDMGDANRARVLVNEAGRAGLT
jgi:hypothetical protein